MRIRLTLIRSRHSFGKDATMNVQVITRDGVPEYAVIPWDEYQALLVAAGREPAAEQAAAPGRMERPSLSRLAELRETADLDTDSLARSIGISPAYMTLIERGERLPDAAIRRALARVLGVDGWEEDD